MDLKAINEHLQARNNDYVAEKGRPLYRNPLPRDAQGHPKLPANAVVALVNFTCENCHDFMAKANYPTKTADGRPILYVDMHDPNKQDGRDTAALTYFKDLGLTGEIGKGQLETAFGKKLALHGQEIRLPDGSDVPHATFPVLLETDPAGKLTGRALSAGIADSVALVKHGTQSALKNATKEVEYSELSQTDKDLVDRAVYRNIVARDGKGYQFTSAVTKEYKGKPDSKEIEQEIIDQRNGLATLLHGKDAKEVRGELARHGAQAPAAPEARKALELVINFNTIECGCTLAEPPAPKAVNLNDILSQATPKGAQPHTRNASRSTP